MTPAISVPHAAAVEISIDGDGSDPAWAAAVPIGAFTNASSAPGAPPTLPTQVVVLSDDHALYVRVRCEDTDVFRLRKGLGRRDTRLEDDLVTLYLDPAGTGQRAYLFGLNPLGSPIDGTRTAVSDEDDLAWDARWKGAARVDEGGWTAEFAIPWRSVRHGRSVDTLGLLVVREVPRLGETSTWPALNPKKPGWLTQEGVLGGPGALPTSVGLDVIPELTFGWSEAGPDAERWAWEGLGPGATVRWSAAANSVVATVNPDFAEVESDDPQIAVNRRYALYYEEKRPFFLDGQEAFQSPGGDLVYSRSIGVPRYGVRATAEGGGWTFAAVHVLDAAPGETVSEGGGWDAATVAGAQALDTVARVHRDFGAGGFVGLIASDRELLGVGSGESLGNRLGGLDARVPLGETDALTAAALVSQTDGVDDGAPGTSAELSWTHGARGVSAWLDGSWISPGFRAENGFVTRADWLGAKAGVDLQAYPDKGPIHRLRFTPAQGEVGWNSEGELRAYDLQPELSTHFTNGMKAVLAGLIDGELYNGTFLSYQQPNVGGGGSITRGVAAFARVYAGTGPYYDETNPRVASLESGALTALVQVGPRVALSLDGVTERMHEGDEVLYSGVVARFRVDTFVTPQLSGRLVLDASTFDATRGTDLLLAWELDPGTAVFLDGKLAWEETTLASWQVIAKASRAFSF